MAKTKKTIVDFTNYLDKLGVDYQPGTNKLGQTVIRIGNYLVTEKRTDFATHEIEFFITNDRSPIDTHYFTFYSQLIKWADEKFNN